MRVFQRPDDVLRTKRRIAAEEDAGPGRLHGHAVHHRHVPIAELDAEISLDPRKRVLLSDGKDDVVARIEDAVESRRLASLAIPPEAVELHAGELSALDHEPARRVIDHDLDTFLLGIVQLPGGRLEETAGPARHDADVAPAETPRRAAAVHRGVPHADDEHALAYRRNVLECDRLEPVDA